VAVRYPRVVLLDRDTGETLAQVPAPTGATVYDAFERVNQRLPTRCRGSSICGLCRVEVHSGTVQPAHKAPDETALLRRVAPDEPAARLACRLRLAPGEDRLELTIDGDRWRRARSLDRV